MSYNTDPNELKVCPYDSSHKIAASRFQIHLLKCAKSHPEKKRTLLTCPFNATHKYEEPDRDKHLLECPDNYHAFNLLASSTRLNPIPSYESRTNNDNEEDWDEDEPKVPVQFSNDTDDDDIKIIDEKLPVEQKEKKIETKKSERRDDIEENEQKPAKIKSMGRGLWTKNK